MGDDSGEGTQKGELKTSYFFLRSTQAFSLHLEIQGKRPKYSCSVNPYFGHHFVQHYLEKSLLIWWPMLLIYTDKEKTSEGLG